MAKQKTVFVCSDCGAEALRWQGQCPMCKAWNTMSEFSVSVPKNDKPAQSRAAKDNPAVRLSDVLVADETRFRTGMSELDRVLGGGAVAGSLVLLAGEPGIGKSTLLLQICDALGRFCKILYVSGEESVRQIKLRGERLRVADNPNLFVLAETDISAISQAFDDIAPDILIVDSVQTVYDPESNSSPGSVTQVRECTMALMRIAKNSGATVFVVGHVNKEGSVAGPKVLEHIVDCVLYFEGDLQYRVLRAAKNRFGSTHEIGVFEMRDVGLIEVPNPSEALLSGRPRNVPGSCIACVMEGTRPLLTEIQALVTPTSYNYPRRMANGIELNRALLLLAVLEKRGGDKRFFVGNADAYINVIGGFSIDETAADLPTLIALASGMSDKPVPEGLAAFGEVGLSGEVRAANSAEQRLNEIRRLGFTVCIAPFQGTRGISVPEGLELVRVKYLGEALSRVLV